MPETNSRAIGVFSYFAPSCLPALCIRLVCNLPSVPFATPPPCLRINPCAAVIPVPFVLA